MPCRPAPASHAQRAGLTLVELMAVAAVVMTVLLLTVPSMRDLIERQRLRSVNAQLITDLQFARSEAVRRNTKVLVQFDQNDSLSCYVIFAGPATCDCKGTPGSACNRLVTTELRTVQVPRSASVRLDLPTDPTQSRRITIDHRTGGMVPVLGDTSTPSADPFVVSFRGDHGGQLRISINPAGRLSVCSPGGSVSGMDSCE